MATIVEKTLLIKVSVLVKNEADAPDLIDETFVDAIGEMASQLIADPRAIVEVLTEEDLAADADAD